MTTGRKDHVWRPPHKVLLIHDGHVVQAHGHPDRGPALPIVASLLLDGTFTHAYLAGINLYELFAELNVLMEGVPGWRIRFTNRRRYAFVKGEKKVVTGRFFADYICMDQRVAEKRLPRKRCDIINLDLLREKPPLDPDEQMQMTLAILEICDKRGISFRTTRGAIGNALLKASPMWEPKRYAAPKFINDAAREYLPGNFYAVSNKVDLDDENTFDHCFYLDQESAHHSIAKELEIAHPQHIHARGNWKSLEGCWAKPETPAGKEILSGNHYGLILVKMNVATIPPTQRHLYPPWALTKGNRLIWLWTPELRLLSDRRFQLDYIVASFTATARDMVISEYAGWALEELSSNVSRAGYKKGSLLAAYGMLAFNSAGHTIYRYWGGHNTKKLCEIPRAGMVGESRITIPEDYQLSTVNVIARGLIEAETRMRSIEFARELTNLGYHVPQIYADGLLVHTDQLPFMPDGWKVSHSLTHVRIPRTNAIVSDQIVKMPGQASADEQGREWARMRMEARARLSNPSAGPVVEEVVSLGAV